jgi:hypothetical protein
MVIVYDHSFNQNEWFVLSLLVFGGLLLFLLPKRFSLYHSICYCLFGIFISMFYDHTISVLPFDFYDVNDSSLFEWMDFLSYVIYAPFSYLYVYLHDRFQLKPKYIPIYMLIWAIASIGMEWLALYFKLYHYKNGYQLAYSIPIYLITQCLLLALFHVIQDKSYSARRTS